MNRRSMLGALTALIAAPKALLALKPESRGVWIGGSFTPKSVTVRRTSLPSVQWRKLNEGVTPVRARVRVFHSQED